MKCFVCRTGAASLGSCLFPPPPPTPTLSPALLSLFSLQERLLINITEYHKMSIGSPTMPSEAYLAAEAAATARRSVSPPRRMAPLHSPGGRLYPQQSLSEQQSSSLGSPHYVSAMVSTLDSGAVGGSSGYVPGGPGASASSLPAMDASGSGSISGGIQTAGSLSPSGSQHAGAPVAPGPANAWNRANLGSAGSYGSLLGSTYGGGGSVTGPAFDSGSVVSYASFGSQMPRPDLSQPYQPPAAGGVVPPKPSYVPAGGAPAPGYDFSRLLSGPGAADASSAFLAGTGKFGIGTGQFSGAGGAGGAPRGASAGGPGAEAGAAGRAAMLAGLGGSTATLLGSTSVGSMSMGGSLPSTAGTVGTEGLGATGTTLLAGVGTGSGRQTPSGLPGSRGVLGGVGSNIVGSGAGSRAPSGGYLRSASVGSVQSITTPTNAAAPVFPPVQPSAPQ